MGCVGDFLTFLLLTTLFLFSHPFFFPRHSSLLSSSTLSVKKLTSTITILMIWLSLPRHHKCHHHHHHHHSFWPLPPHLKYFNIRCSSLAHFHFLFLSPSFYTYLPTYLPAYVSEQNVLHCILIFCTSPQTLHPTPLPPFAPLPHSPSPPSFSSLFTFSPRTNSSTHHN